MAYADQEDIENEIKGIEFSSTSSLTASALSEILEQESAVIDQYLLTQYQLPIINTGALNVLKKICIDFVVFRVEKILKKSNDSNDTNMPQKNASYSAYKNSMKLLKMFANSELSLNGASRLAAKTKIMGITPDKNLTERVFKKDEVQW